MKSIFINLDKLIRIDPKSRHTKQDYYFGDQTLLKITSLSPLKNGLFFLMGSLALFFSVGFLFVEGLAAKLVGLIFLPIFVYSLFSRRELLISDGLVRRIAYLDLCGRKYVLWKSELVLADFSSAELTWTSIEGRTNMESQGNVRMYSEKSGITIDIMPFLLNRDGAKLLSEIILKVEKIIHLTIEVEHRESYMGKY